MGEFSVTYDLPLFLLTHVLKHSSIKYSSLVKVKAPAGEHPKGALRAAVR